MHTFPAFYRSTGSGRVWKALSNTEAHLVLPAISRWVGGPDYVKKGERCTQPMDVTVLGYPLFERISG